MVWRGGWKGRRGESCGLLLLVFLRNAGQALGKCSCKEAARGGLATGWGSLRTTFLQMGVEIQTPVTAVQKVHLDFQISTNRNHGSGAWMAY